MDRVACIAVGYETQRSHTNAVMSPFVFRALLRLGSRGLVLIRIRLSLNLN